MDKDNQMTCGCDCDSCKQGDHEHCQTGKCKWQKTDEDDEQ